MPSPHLQTPKTHSPAARTSDLLHHPGVPTTLRRPVPSSSLYDHRQGWSQWWGIPLKGAGAISHLPSQPHLCIRGARENSTPHMAEGQMGIEGRGKRNIKVLF